MIVGAVLVMIVAMGQFAVAKGPANAGGNNKEYYYSEHSDMYMGPDYGLGTTPTTCSDGTWIDVITNAAIQDNGHYVSDPGEPYAEKDWVTYKFWLSEPVLVIYPNGEEYAATNHIFLKVLHGIGEIVLQSCK